MHRRHVVSPVGGRTMCGLRLGPVDYSLALCARCVRLREQWDAKAQAAADWPQSAEMRRWQRVITALC